MKITVITFLLYCSTLLVYAQDNSSLNAVETNHSITVSKVSSAERKQIKDSPSGLFVYDTDTKSFWTFDSKKKTWKEFKGKDIEFISADSSEYVVKMGSEKGSTNIKENGTILYEGDATVFDDITIPVTSSKSDGSKQPAFDFIRDNGMGSHGIFTYWFDGETEEELFFTVQLPHKWKEGSDIFPHVHWIPPRNMDSTKVRWGLEYVWTNIGDTLTTTDILTNDTPIPSIKNPVAFQHTITELGVVSGKNKTISSMLVCRVFRDAESDEDTFDDEVGLLQIDFHYEIDSDGSNEEYIK